MEVIATKERKTFWVGYIWTVCLLFTLFVSGALIALWHFVGWAVSAWCALIALVPLFLVWGMVIAYVVAPSVLAEYDGSTLYLYGRRAKCIPIRELRGASVLHLNGTLFSRTVILIVTVDRKKYRIKYAQSPNDVCNRLEDIARI